MSNNNIEIELSNSNLEEKVKDLIKSLDKKTLRELINAYYTLNVQQHINDKEYAKLESLEGLLDLYNLIDNVG